MSLKKAKTLDETQVQQLISEQADAICAKDIERLMAFYLKDAVVFDVKPPHQLKGAAAIRRMWLEGFPCLPESFGIDTKDLSVEVKGNLAFAHWLFNITGERNHPATTMTLRLTGCYQRTKGKWQIVHEHCSVPFNPSNC